MSTTTVVTMNKVDDYESASSSSSDSDNDTSQLPINEKVQSMSPVPRTQPFMDKVDKKIGFIMLTIGTGYLFPFESLILSLDYFSILYPDKKIYSSFPFIYVGGIVITFLIFLKVPHFGTHSKRMISGFLFYILMMILVPVLNISSIGGSLTSYILTLILVALTGVADAFVQGTVYSIAGMFGPQYTLFTQIGVGLAGIIVVITRVISKVAFPYTEEGQKHGCLLYFLISAVIILFSLVAYLFLMQQDEIKDYLSEKKLKKDMNSSDANVGSSITPKKDVYKYILKENLSLGLINVMIFVVSGTIFPGLIFEVNQTGPIRSDWYVLIVMGVHNVFDFIGKSLPFFIHNEGKRVPSMPILWAMVISRSIFFLIFFLAIFNYIPYYWIIILIPIFGFTNGYLCSIAMSEGPRRVVREHKGLSGLFMTTMLVIGITIGNALNFMITSLLDK